jgi:hypothetical protein
MKRSMIMSASRAISRSSMSALALASADASVRSATAVSSVGLKMDKIKIGEILTINLWNTGTKRKGLHHRSPQKRTRECCHEIAPSHSCVFLWGNTKDVV